jgi:hypothetical protein
MKHCTVQTWTASRWRNDVPGFDRTFYSTFRDSISRTFISNTSERTENAFRTMPRDNGLVQHRFVAEEENQSQWNMRATRSRMKRVCITRVHRVDHCDEYVAPVFPLANAQKNGQTDHSAAQRVRKRFAFGPAFRTGRGTGNETIDSPDAFSPNGVRPRRVSLLVAVLRVTIYTYTL